jgi:hypothetical protein
MANRYNDWQGMIKLANEDLKKYGAMILHHEDEEDGTFSVEILYGLDFANFDVTKYKECEEFAENYYEDELSELINDAWHHARAKAKAMLKPKKAKKSKSKEYPALVDPEPKKVWVMTQESNVDGEILFNTLVCDSEKTALTEMQREIEWIKNESFHFRNFDERGDDFEVEQSEHRFFINDDTDDYYEEIIVKETEIITL